MNITIRHQSNIIVLAMGKRINQTVKNLPRFLSIGISSAFYFVTKVLHPPYIEILKDCLIYLKQKDTGHRYII